MIFVSFTSAYLVRQGLPTLDPRTDALVRDWIPVRLPNLLLINTCVLLVSSLTMALARRQLAREVALVRFASLPGTSAGHEPRISWLMVTVFLGLSFLTMQWLAWRELAASGFYAFAWRGFRPSCGRRRSTATPSAEFTADYFGRDRLVLAFHGDFVDLYFLFARVCTLNQPRPSFGGAELGDQTHG
jgi:hypothetical protein